MIQVTVFLLSSFIDYWPPEISGNPFVWEFKAGTTIRELLMSFNIPLDEVTSIFVNDLPETDLERILENHDKLVVLPFTIGG